MSISLNKKEKLIYSLLFSDSSLFEINIEEFCKIEDRPDFRENIRLIIKKGGLLIKEDTIVHKEDKIIWKIILKK